MRAWVRLTAEQRAALDAALDPHDLAVETAQMLEAHLTSYRNRDRRVRSTSTLRRLASAGRRMLVLMASDSTEDHREAAEAAEDDAAPSELLVNRLKARVTQWEAAAARPRLSHRPPDDSRRALLRRTLGVLDDAGIPWKRRSGHVDGPRVRALRVVLQIADELDGVSRTQGSLRLIKAALRECRDRRPRS
jgi:hypothetical protein